MLLDETIVDYSMCNVILTKLERITTGKKGLNSQYVKSGTGSVFSLTSLTFDKDYSVGKINAARFQLKTCMALKSVARKEELYVVNTCLCTVPSVHTEKEIKP